MRSESEIGGEQPGGITVLPAGPQALLLEVAGLDEVLALDAALREAVARGEGPWASVTDVVPAARTVLLHTQPGADLAAIATASRTLAAASLTSRPDFVRLPCGPTPQTTRDSAPKSHEVAGGGRDEGEVKILVRYDGADLAEVATMIGLTPAEVVRAHTSTPWRVAFGGFVPGFGYLVGGDPRLHVPRRESPRTQVPAGSVALAGEFTGVYPRASPGGWRLIGTTDAVLWDPDRSPPAVLTPGTRVRFVDVEASR